MAIERVLFSIKQDIMIRASELAEENARLLRDGKLDEATVKMGEIQAEMDRTKTIDELVPDVLGRLQAAGIEQPSIDYLGRLVTLEPTIAMEASAQPSIPPTSPAIKPTIVTPPAEAEVVRTPPSPTEVSPVDLFEDLPIKGLQSREVRTLNAIKTLTIKETRVYSKEEIADEMVRQSEAAGGETLKREGLERAITRRVSVINSYFKDGEHQFRVASPLIAKEEGKRGRRPVGHLLVRAKDETELTSIEEDYSNKRGLTEQTVPGTPTLEPSGGTIAPGVPEGVEDEEPLNPQLSSAEMYRLGQSFDQTNDEQLARMGIRLPAEDREAVSEILGRLASFPDVVENAEGASETLSKKLTAFVKDKQTVFMANMEDEDTQFLLTFLAGIESEDQIRQLLRI